MERTINDDVLKLNAEVKNLRAELDEMKEMLRGLIQYIMKQDSMEDDEFN
ncbi:hypothetical protein [Caldiplasma sukawensis]